MVFEDQQGHQRSRSETCWRRRSVEAYSFVFFYSSLTCSFPFQVDFWETSDLMDSEGEITVLKDWLIQVLWTAKKVIIQNCLFHNVVNKMKNRCV